MDADQFDTLTTRLGAHLTRRRGLGLLSGLGIASLGVADHAEAKKRKKKKKKRKTPCGLCETCQKGTCKPISGQKVCGAACVASNACCTDGLPGCPAGTPCTGGTCIGCTKLGGACSDPQTCCSGVCSGGPGNPGQCMCFKKGKQCLSDSWCCGGDCVKARPGDREGVCGCGTAGNLCDAVSDCCNTCSQGVCT